MYDRKPTPDREDLIEILRLASHACNYSMRYLPRAKYIDYACAYRFKTFKEIEILPIRYGRIQVGLTHNTNNEKVISFVLLYGKKCYVFAEVKVDEFDPSKVMEAIHALSEEMHRYKIELQRLREQGCL